MSQETNGSWRGVRVRDKNGRCGTIISDDNNWHTRYLDIRFDDGSIYVLTLANGGRNPPDKHGIQWEYNPGKWARINDQ